jgi:predicted acyltransferase
VRPVPGGDGIIAKETGFTNVQQLRFAGTNQLRGVFIKGVNLANYLDQRYFPGAKYDGTWDPEGPLTVFPAGACCLLGALAGLWIQSPRPPARRKVLILVAGGAAGVVLGFMWGTQFPVIKKIWTSSYVLVAGGYSAMLLGGFYLVVDVLGYRAWCQPFVWIGMNPITLYLTKNIIGGYTKLAQRFTGGDIKTFFDTQVAQGLGDLVIAITGLLLVFWLAHFLHRRKIFLRL